jgi:hypothetical protein
MVLYESWIDRQIREATERGEFDNLPGAGKPIPGLTGRTDENWWVKGLLEREKIKPVLPGSLALRKEVEDLPVTLDDVGSEDAVREIVAELNARIVDARRRGVDGPRVLIRTVEVESAVTAWRQRREA